MKTAIRHGWIDQLPDLSGSYRSSPKISQRAWFSADEYKTLYEATRYEPKQPRFKRESEQLHDYVLFSANTGLGPDEARRLQFRDVTIVVDEGSGQTILEIKVRGKRGVSYCKSVSGAVLHFERLKARLRPGRKGSRFETMANGEWHKPAPSDLIFPKWQRELFNAVLGEENLRVGRNHRPPDDLRHTYTCLRLWKVLTSSRSSRIAAPASR